VEWITGMPLKHGERAKLKIDIDIKNPVEDLSLGIGFSTIDGIRIANYNSESSGRDFKVGAGLHSFFLEIEELPLNPATFSLDAGCKSGIEQGLDYIQNIGIVDVVPGPKTSVHFVGKEPATRLHGTWSVC
jgi:hypothetical protein